MKTIIGIKVSIRHLKRKLAKLRRKELKTEKTLKAIEGIESKLKKRIDILEKAGVSLSFQRKPKRVDFGFGGYKKYINSKEWADRKSAYYSIHEKVCRSCGHGDREIHLHHRTYARIYQEDDSDLMPLCVDCHAMLHEFQKSLGLPVEDATRMWMSATNETPDKKKIRAALRDVSFRMFGRLWGKRSKLGEAPAILLAKTIARIVKGKFPARDDAIDDLGSIKKSIAITARTGDSGSYDKKVDAIIRKLERSVG